MQTFEAGAMVFFFKCWTVYSSVNLYPFTGLRNCWNSLSVCLPRLFRSTRNRIRLASA
jgi:hypothetical protein